MSRATDAEVQRQARTTTTLSTYLSSESLESLQHGDEVDVDSVQRQISALPAENRKVLRSLGGQLMLTISKLVKAAVRTPSIASMVRKLEQKLALVWFQANNRRVADIRKFLIVQSCCEFSAVFGAVHGVGTEPFLLYHSNAFDS